MYSPQAIVDVDIAQRNIGKMIALAERDQVRLRPHFKTHQSALVAEWYSNAGITQCAVSNIEMAELFVAAGWKDVLLALPAKPFAASAYQALAEQCQLGLIGDSLELVISLDETFTCNVDFWIEVDAGYGRTGMRWDETEGLLEIVRAVRASRNLNLKGFLIHAGNSYQCRGKGEIRDLAEIVCQRLASMKSELADEFDGLEISYGDTPTCSIGCDVSDFDEIRPGNFVFYDLMQVDIGACELEQIALTIECPVIGKYSNRNEIVIHGGAVHLSKERLDDGSYGMVLDGKQNLIGHLTSLSQEHGIVTLEHGVEVDSFSLGQSLTIYPVHSCLAIDCLCRGGDGLKVRS